MLAKKTLPGLEPGPLGRELSTVFARNRHRDSNQGRPDESQVPCSPKNNHRDSNPGRSDESRAPCSPKVNQREPNPGRSDECQVPSFDVFGRTTICNGFGKPTSEHSKIQQISVINSDTKNKINVNWVNRWCQFDANYYFSN